MPIKFYEHPEFVAGKPKWEMYKDCFEGDQETLRQDKYLVRFVLETGTEGTKALEQRLKRTFYTNLTKRIVLAWKGFLFKKDPIFEGNNFEDIFSEEEQADIDGEGTSLDDFIKNEIGCTYLVYGKPYTVVDSDPENPIRPFGEVLTPLDVIDWQRVESGENTGKFHFLHHQFMNLPFRDNGMSKPTERLLRKAWVTDGSTVLIQTFEAEVTKDAPGVTKIGEVNWMLVDESVASNFTHIPIRTIQGESWIKDVVPEQLRFHNGTSSYELVLHSQAYRLLFIAGSLRDKKSANIPAGESNVIWLEDGGTVNAVPAENPAALQIWLQDVKNTLVEVGLNQFNRLDATTKSVASDDTIREQKQEIVSLARTTLTELEGLCNAFLEDWAISKGKDPGDAKIVLEKDFQDQDVERLINIFMAIKAEVGPETKKLFTGKLIDQVEFDEESRQSIADEMETFRAGSNGIPRQRERLLGRLNATPESNTSDEGDRETG